MTIEEIKAEMYKRKCSSASVESKTAAVIFDIISGEESFYANRADALKELKEREIDVQHKERAFWIKQRNLEDSLNSLNKQIEETNSRIEAIEKALQACETPAGRDAMRRALTFKNSVSVYTKYDNTAFIIGLAAILGDGDFAPIEELQKINGKIPTIDERDLRFKRWGKRY